MVDFQKVSTEFLFTNRYGGYCLGSINGFNTRKYHGLLISGFDKNGLRYVLLNTLEEEVVFQNQSTFLSNHHYGSTETVYPRGYRNLQNVKIIDQNWPTQSIVWIFKVFEDVIVEKKLTFYRDQERLELGYTLLQVPSKAVVKIIIRPLLAWRDIHKLQTRDARDGALNLSEVSKQRSWEAVDQNGQKLYLNILQNGQWAEDFLWYNNFYYDQEARRGYPAQEDLWSPGRAFFNLTGDKPQAQIEFGAWVQSELAVDCVLDKLDKEESLWTNENWDQGQLARSLGLSEAKLSASLPQIKVWWARLFEQTADFLAYDQRANLGVIAGYPWFGMWSRDTFLAFEGLLIKTKRWQAARQLLLQWGQSLHNGFLPNILEETQPRFHFVADSTLLYIMAIGQYQKATGDTDVVEELWSQIEAIIVAYLQPSSWHWMDEDGFMHFVSDGSKAATWMDALVFNQAITPRYGACVEIQALWFNALKLVQKWAKELGGQRRLATIENVLNKTFKSLKSLENLSSSLKEKSSGYFWDEEREMIKDLIGHEAKKDDSLSFRPNQLFGWALEYPLFSQELGQKIMPAIEQKLLTDVGLKTLDKQDKHYQGRYFGPQATRDKAYHQGTVWPWLLGIYGQALRNIYDERQIVDDKITKQASRLFSHCDKLGLLYIPEVFGADDLSAGGTIHQAWNVGQIFGMLCDVLQN